MERIGRTPTDAFKIQKRLIAKNKPIIFDIGAYHGEVTKMYRGLFPNSLIHCFEPFPASYDVLCENIKNDQHSFPHSTAVSDKEGKVYLNCNSEPATNSLLKTDEIANSFWGVELFKTLSKVEVFTTTLDLFCKKEAYNIVENTHQIWLLMVCDLIIGKVECPA